MKFIPIDEKAIVYPGEYVYHTPSSAIVLVGAFNRDEDTIRVLKQGRLLEDHISSFQKIALTDQEGRKFKTRRGCGGCKGR